MATIQICDMCHTNKDVKKHIFIIGRQPDLSGNGYDNIQEIYDLCDQCAVKVLSYGVKVLHNNLWERRLLANKEMVFFIKNNIDTPK